MHVRPRAITGAVIAAALAGSLALVHPAEAQGEGECHPSYDPCVPIADDVDCAGGEGDGPVFVEGPVEVIGPDEYDLDRDGDGVGCEDDGAGAPTPAPAADAPQAPAAAPVERAPSFTG